MKPKDILILCQRNITYPIISFGRLRHLRRTAFVAVQVSVQCRRQMRGLDFVTHGQICDRARQLQDAMTGSR